MPRWKRRPSSERASAVCSAEKAAVPRCRAGDCRSSRSGSCGTRSSANSCWVSSSPASSESRPAAAGRRHVGDVVPQRRATGTSISILCLDQLVEREITGVTEKADVRRSGTPSAVDRRKRDVASAPRALGGADEILCGEGAECFSHGRTAHSELSGEHRFVGQPGTPFQRARRGSGRGAGRPPARNFSAPGARARSSPARRAARARRASAPPAADLVGLRHPVTRNRTPCCRRRTRPCSRTGRTPRE